MAGIDMRTLGERIRAARQRADLSQDAIGRAIGVDRTVINKIESGVRKVTALELSDIADAMNTRMSSFFEDPIPALVAHRSSQGLDTADSAIDALLAACADEVELVARLGGADLMTAADLDDEIRLKGRGLAAHADVEELARTTRNLMDLTSDEPIGRLSDAAERIGVLVFARDIGKDTADAGLIALRSGAVAFVNSHMSVGRRRFALAHEVGHFLLADEYTVDWRLADRGDAPSSVETRLDRFARALLLPATAMERIWSELAEQHGVRGAAVVLASRYRVDMSTIAARLRELRLADAETRSIVRGARTTKTDILDLNLNVPPEEMEGTTIPKGYARAVLHLVREERVSRERALDLLHDTFDYADLPAPRRRREDEIWAYVS